MNPLHALALSLALRAASGAQTSLALHVARLTAMLTGGALLGIALVLLVGLRGRRRIGAALLVLAALLISLGLIPSARAATPSFLAARHLAARR